MLGSTGSARVEVDGGGAREEDPPRPAEIALSGLLRAPEGVIS
jgi:hypothetical protein